MRKLLLGVAFALMASSALAQQAPEKDITVTFSPQEQKALLSMMDEAVKAKGLTLATAAAIIQQKMMNAAKAPPPAAAKEQPK
jgi:ABC-type metal ion transport system substrate-binding protein